MACRDCRKKVVARPTQAPAWADASASVAQSSFTFVEVVLPMGTTVQLCPADPRRWAVGFSRVNHPMIDIVYCPGDNPAQFGFLGGQGIGFGWFDTLHFGPMVQAAWNGFSSAGQTVRVWQVYRLPERSYDATGINTARKKPRS